MNQQVKEFFNKNNMEKQESSKIRYVEKQLRKKKIKTRQSTFSFELDESYNSINLKKQKLLNSLLKQRF